MNVHLAGQVEHSGARRRSVPRKFFAAVVGIGLLVTGLWLLVNVSLLLMAAGSLRTGIDHLQNHLDVDPLLIWPLKLSAGFLIILLLRGLASTRATRWRVVAIAIMLAAPLLAWFVVRLQDQSGIILVPGTLKRIRLRADRRSTPSDIHLVASEAAADQFKKYAQQQVSQVSNPWARPLYDPITGIPVLWVDPETCTFYNMYALSEHSGKPLEPAASYLQPCHEKQLVVSQRTQMDALQAALGKLSAENKRLIDEVQQLRSESERLNAENELKTQAIAEIHAETQLKERTIAQLGASLRAAQTLSLQPVPTPARPSPTSGRRLPGVAPSPSASGWRHFEMQ